MTLYENLEEFCLNFVNYWNTNEELEDIGSFSVELRNMIDESVEDIERTIQQIREEEKKWEKSDFEKAGDDGYG